MKKWIVWITVFLMLTGCGAEPAMETVADVMAMPAVPEPRAIAVALPGETSMPAMESDAGRSYMASDYEICIQTVTGGDLDATVQTMSGFSADELTLVTTQSGDLKRHDFVWAAAGEGGDLLGRGVILDDGIYHYTMAVLRNAHPADGSAVVWDGVFSSFRLV